MEGVIKMCGRGCRVQRALRGTRLVGGAGECRTSQQDFRTGVFQTVHV